MVFQTPPEPTATYQLLWSLGWIAMSAILPDIRAGPIARSSRPASVSAVRAGAGVGAGAAAWAAAGAKRASTRAMRSTSDMRNLRSETVNPLRLAGCGVPLGLGEGAEVATARAHDPQDRRASEPRHDTGLDDPS